MLRHSNHLSLNMLAVLGTKSVNGFRLLQASKLGLFKSIQRCIEGLGGSLFHMG